MNIRFKLNHFNISDGRFEREMFVFHLFFKKSVSVPSETFTDAVNMQVVRIKRIRLLVCILKHFPILDK